MTGLQVPSPDATHSPSMNRLGTAVSIEPGWAAVKAVARHPQRRRRLATMQPMPSPEPRPAHHPERLWRNPEPKRAYDVVIIGGGGHGLATAYYLAKHHGITNVAVLERGWLAGGNIARNTTIIRSNYLWDESAAIYEHSLKLWEGLSEELDYDLLFSQRGVINLAHNLDDVREGMRRVNANRLNGVDAEWLEPDDVERLCPIVNVSPDVRYPILGATYQPRGGIAKHDHVAWGYARAADALGVDLIEHCEVTGIDLDGRPRRPASRPFAGRSPPGRSRSSPRAMRRRGRDGRDPAAAAEPSRSRRWSRSCSSRSTRTSSCPTPSTCTSARRTRASW